MSGAVLIPAYRPDGMLEEIAEQLLAMGLLVVVVDDGSGEAYQQIFSDLEPSCTTG